MIEKSWDEQIISLPQCHFLQTSEWAEVKQEVGWQAEQMTWQNSQGELIGAANLLTRSLKLLGIGPKMTIGYIPRGPLLDWNDDNLRQKVLNDVQEYAHQHGLIFIKIDPEVELGRGIPGEEGSSENARAREFEKDLQQRGWKYSVEQIQFKNTAVLDLSGSEEDWLKKMKQKARYNLRLSQRSGVNIRVAKDEEFPVLYQMYAQTAARDHFIIREMDYYLGVWRRFIQAGMAEPLIAEVEGQAVAGLILFHLGKKAWYFYGMSTSLHREKMPNYLLQWEAMRLAKSLGCEVYDLWGAPDVFDPADRMYGVFRFKDGLGATVIRTVGAWDFPVKPFLFFIYHQILPRFLSITRWLRRGKLEQEIK
jgi:peptidoglycan pentaglycine glycine transferase (the first glycine)